MTAEYGTILQYSIVCSAQNLTGQLHIDIVGRNTTQFVVTALNPYTTYDCCVTAENVAGNGVPICGEGNTFEDGEGCNIQNRYKSIGVFSCSSDD